MLVLSMLAKIAGRLTSISWDHFDSDDLKSQLYEEFYA